MDDAWSRKNAWDRAPNWIKGSLGRALGVIPTRYLLGRRFRAHARMVREAQWWSRSQARAYQLRHLRRICTLAAQRTVFYRELFREAGFRPQDLTRPEDLAAAPMIDRETVEQHLASMCTVPPSRPWVDHVTTAGTSGRPLEFFVGADRSAREFAYLSVSWERIGYTLDTPMAVLRGDVVAPNRRGMHHQYDPVLRRHVYSSFHMSDAHMAAYLDHMDRLGPIYLHAYPSTAAVLAHFMARIGRLPPPGLSGVILESEIVYPRQRRMIEATFGCRCLACYGHSEKLVLATECEHGGGYHVWPTYGYLELVDQFDQPVRSRGQRGEIVGTGFINTVVPFIRYRTGDYATYEADRCEQCGREHTVLTDIRGHRVQESLIAANGDTISWTALNMHDDTFSCVRQFQFAQSVPGEAVLRIVPAEGFGPDDHARIHRNLGAKLDGRIEFTIQTVQSIPLTPVGKSVYVDQHIENPAMYQPV